MIRIGNSIAPPSNSNIHVMNDKPGGNIVNSQKHLLANLVRNIISRRLRDNNIQYVTNVAAAINMCVDVLTKG